MTEERWFRAAVRPHGSIGQFTTKDFIMTVTVTGSHCSLMAEAIGVIHSRGFEVHHIVAHSSKRETL